MPTHRPSLTTPREGIGSAGAPGTRRRILFISEAPSLAHIARPFVLASALDPARFDIHFAAAPTGWVEHILSGTSFTRWPLESIPEESFARRMRFGRPFWSPDEIERYVEVDRELIRAVRPDLIVADLRVSLSISARLEGVPWAAIINATWSPYAGGWRQPVPQTTLSTPYLPGATQFWFDRLLPLLLRWYVRPVNVVRRRFGLEPHPPTHEALFNGDHVLYVDPPGVIPFRHALPAHHRFIGAPIWNAAAPLPPWWDALDGSRPVLSVSIGSSGKLSLLPTIVRALGQMPVLAAVAAGGRSAALEPPPNVFVAPLLPGNLLAQRAALVITNGGTPGLYQALNEGAPVLGIPENLDQHMTMAAVERHGATRSIRSDQLSVRAIRRSVDLMLEGSAYRDAAQRLAERVRAHRPSELFPAFVDEFFATSRGQGAA